MLTAPSRLDALAWYACTTGHYNTCASIADHIDALTAFTYSLPACAHAYASCGITVFPLQPGRKTPMKGFKWRQQATNNPEIVASWWRRWPDANIGLPTGLLFDVIDCDGWEAWTLYGALSDTPPQIGLATTARPGGFHIYTPPTGDGNHTNSRLHIDYRGLGGYVVAPPSRIGDNTYRWRHWLNVDSKKETPHV